MTETHRSGISTFVPCAGVFAKITSVFYIWNGAPRPTREGVE